MKRNQSIELLKFFFAISIALGHFSKPIIDGGTVVTLFFVLSGFFLVKSFDSGKYKTPWQYSAGRIRRIYPYYIFAFLLFFTLGQAEYLLHPVQFFKILFSKLPEMLLLQDSGLFSSGVNYPLWQLSTLVIGSHILFSLLMLNRQAVLNAVCPLLALGAFTYLTHLPADADVWGVAGGFIYIPLLRAVAGLAVGMFAHDPVTRIVGRLENSACARMPLLISLASIPVLLAFWVNRDSYAAMLPFLMLLVCMLYSGGFWARTFRFSALARLDKLSLALYVNHAAVIRGFRYLAKVPALAFMQSDVVFVIVLLIYSMLMLLAVDGLMKLAKRFRAVRA